MTSTRGVVMEYVYLLIILGFFLVSIGLVEGLERLRKIK
ncbi:hypothetical protein Acaty_m0105 (plasmid) [Acidithiobacillus caldus ATCC 51756]|uniref:Uncharacterized protein n=1 Tax=Acidithiobacillus caldus (strain ATCC 51756 / DSM 8584 / KU) TaxID=637389 RepID=A0A059ZZ01_ACICK|nr:hypothetical protein Acaty_m0105 [Acidithiobacillus caldus ATCC 51756]